MTLAWIDWLIIAAYFALSLGIGLYYKSKAENSLNDFFLGGRNLPWYVAGVSMVATTFAADTPLAVNELVAQNGIAGNWLWWSFLFGGMLTTFFFAKLWRRAEILTEVEFIELRYGGKAASFLRGFKGLYLGLFMNTLIIGWVNVALIAILKVFFGISGNDALMYVGAAMLITSVYSAISGLWGVAITDIIQFVIAMTGCIVLAYLVVTSEKIGGIDGMKEKLPSWSMEFFPKISNEQNGGVAGTLTISIGAFLAYISVQWWASWYPGSEPGGGGYVAQRMMSAKTEKDSIYATLFFNIAHYCIRPWPWILVGLCSIILYPDLSFADKKLGYVMAMKEFLPTGLKGLLIVAFLAAYMSTISTQLNWGASYLVNDLYKRFIKKENEFENVAKAEKHYVMMSRFFTLFTMIIALAVTTQIESISGVWSFIIECGAGLGLVLILRWYWWRINAWSEIAATITPFFLYGISKYNGLVFPNSFFITVFGTTIVWIVVTYLTKPETDEKLIHFYEKVRPDGIWKPIMLKSKSQQKKNNLAQLGMCWLSAVSMTYSALFFSGKFIFKEYSQAGIYFSVCIFSFLVLRHFLKKTKIMED